MVVHWLRLKSEGWQRRAAMNGVGAVATGVVAVMQLVTKFTRRAYIVSIAGIVLVAGLLRASRSHYSKVARFLEPQSGERLERLGRIAVSRPGRRWCSSSSQVNEFTARSFPLAEVSRADDFHAATVASDPAVARELQRTWAEMEIDVPLHGGRFSLPGVHRTGGGLRAFARARRRHTVTVIIPEFVVEHWWENFLHNQNALRLKGALLGVPWVVVISIPFHIGAPDAEEDLPEPPRLIEFAAQGVAPCDPLETRESVLLL